MESKEEEKVSTMTGDVATGCGQIRKDITVWLQTCATTNGVVKDKKKPKTKPKTKTKKRTSTAIAVLFFPLFFRVFHIII